MKLKKNICLVLICTVLIGMFFSERIEDLITPSEQSDQLQVTRKQQHIEAMKNGANPNLGPTTIPKDYKIDKNFESHLPLIVIDIGKKEIPVTKSFKKVVDKDGNEDVVITKTKQDPYVEGNISIIDNKDYHNSLADEPTEVSKMKIKYRGNSSIKYKKKQFGIKLLDENGKKRNVNCLGMGVDNEWILNISMIDMSLIRNYMSYNLGSSMFPFTPDCKYCEVVFKDDNGYKYQGLYLMMEKIKQSKDRVDISKYKPKKDKVVSYLLGRDRINKDDLQLDTYGNQKRLTYGRLTVMYPKRKKLKKKAFEYIQNDIDKIDRVVYSDDVNEFSTWNNYLDEQAFTDYFLFNELFGNYDAGNNSTYMYKEKNGKLKMGPLWDYDGAMDNYPHALNNPENVSFQNHPWFDRLVKSEKYVSLLEDRYAMMKSGIFSVKSLDNYIDSVYKFIGNAGKRDWSRWQSVYGKNSRMKAQKDSEGYIVDRHRNTWKEEVQRLKDYFHIKEKYMGKGLEGLETGTIDTSVSEGSYKVVAVVIIFFTGIVMIRRKELYV